MTVAYDPRSQADRETRWTPVVLDGAMDGHGIGPIVVSKSFGGMEAVKPDGWSSS